jgi:hypothetical protein
MLTLPVQGINLVTAFGKKSKSIKLQLLMEFTIGGEEFEAVFLVAPQLNCDVILGCNFLKEYGIQLCFDTERMEYVRQGQSKSFKFEVFDDKVNGKDQIDRTKITSQVATEENCGSNPNEPRTASSQLERKLADVEVTDRVRLEERCEIPHKREVVIATEGERDSTIPAQNNEHLASQVKCSREEKMTSPTTKHVIGLLREARRRVLILRMPMRRNCFKQ